MMLVTNEIANQITRINNTTVGLRPALMNLKP